MDSTRCFANLSIDEKSYIYPALYQSITKVLPKVQIVKDNNNKGKIFQYGEYEELDIDRIHDEENYLINSYIYRKALIRKHYLAHTIHSYVVKNPESILTRAFPDTFNLEVDYAEFLEDSLDEAYELRTEIEKGEKTWILKPSMSDRGQGIRIFKTIDQLQAIFDSFEEDETDEEGEFAQEENHGVITSQLRHFVVQEYLEDPLVLPAYDEKKFHIRTYVVANGSIEVFVYKKMLTLFALSKYAVPEENDQGEIELFGHLTNTCLQGEKASENNSVVEFWELQGLSLKDKEQIFDQLVEIVGEVFKAAVNVDKINFQPLNNAFEIFGLDFIVDSKLNVTLLEINSYPDFKQTGDELKPLIYDLFDTVVQTCVKPFFDEPRVQSDLLIKAYEANVNGP